MTSNAKPGIDRRRVLQGTAALGAAAALPLGTAKAATPKKGGHIVAGTLGGSTSDTLDPGLYVDGFTQSLMNMHGYLTEVGADGSVQPDLAVSWEPSNNGSTWTFELRKGVEFHNGKTVTPKDVIGSINHHRGEDSTSAAKPLVEAIKEMRVDGPNTIVFELDGGNADFPFILTDYHLAIMPTVDGEMDFGSGIGCGQYKMENFQPGISADFVRNPNAWKEGRAHFDSAQILVLKDTNARSTALISGDVHAIEAVEAKTAGLLKRNSSLSVHPVTGTQHYTFPMRTDVAPFDNVDVRRAIKHAINRQDLLEKILFGYGEVSIDVPIGPRQRYYNTELPQTPYDPDQAKFFLKRAGYNTLDVQLSAADAGFTGSVDAAALIQNSARAAGINVEVVREPNDGYWSDIWMNKPWCACYWGGRPTEDQMFSTAYQCGVAWNDTFWCNERFDELLIMARGETNEDLRREMYFEMQAILNDEGGLVAPMFASYVFATSSNIGHPETFASNWSMDGFRWMERWWFDS